MRQKVYTYGMECPQKCKGEFYHGFCTGDKDRYSCKKYDGKPVTAEQLSSILEAGRLAPTAKNLQEQHIYVVQSAEGLDQN